MIRLNTRRRNEYTNLDPFPGIDLWESGCKDNRERIQISVSTLLKSSEWLWKLRDKHRKYLLQISYAHFRLIEELHYHIRIRNEYAIHGHDPIVVIDNLLQFHPDEKQWKWLMSAHSLDDLIIMFEKKHPYFESSRK